MIGRRQPWIASAALDGGFILAPALVMTGFVLLFQRQIAALEVIPLWCWGVLIVGVDVAHVYATLFRTYANPEEWKVRRRLYVLVPLLCWVVGTMLYGIGPLWFWRAIAYLAVFHFIRQQYGFMMIYVRGDAMPGWMRRIDQATIYAATLYPLVYWHTHLPRRFDWFVAGDFVALPWLVLSEIAAVIYILLLMAYGVKEYVLSQRNRRFNVPKNLLLLGTAASWLTGIVVFDNDLAFTALNVVAHGVPYMTLIWVFCRNQGQSHGESSLYLWWRRLFTWRALPLYLVILLILAYIEEGVWDGLVWREHGTIFPLFRFLPAIDDRMTLAWLVPLLALPQMTHYVLDAFIWRLRRDRQDWKAILFARDAA